MDNVSLAEEVPLLFRAILDRVAELEQHGDRRTAARVRSEAIATYSRSWDGKARARLNAILRKAERALPAGRRPEEREVRDPVITTA